MKLSIDTERQTVVIEEGGVPREVPLYSNEAFAHLSRLWRNVGWNQKYTYGFAWLGRPIIQLPEDMVRIQEVIHRVQPDVLVETGVAHGGSLVFYASLFKAIGRGRVIGVDVEIRPKNRQAIEQHPLFGAITLVEGSSTAPEIVRAVREQIRPEERVLVVLDSNHSKAHVARELELYAPLVSQGSYIIATDGIMEDLHDVPRGRAEWRTDNPSAAAREFVATNPDYRLEEPPFAFDETLGHLQITHWPDAYIRRI
jgi:cephalosporin hydroxylase